MTRSNRHRSRGFTLLELLATLLLLGVFSFVAAKLFRLTIRTLEEVPAGQDRVAVLDGMIHTLRLDVWSAGKIDVPDEATLVLRIGERRVRWRFSPLQTTRTDDPADAPERRWRPGAETSVVKTDVSVVVVIGADRIELPSQMLLLAETGGRR